MSRRHYPGIVEKTYERHVRAQVQVGQVELTLSFPRAVMEHYHLVEKGCYFNWYPSTDGSVGLENIKPRRVKDITDKHIKKSLARLCCPRTIDDLQD